MKRAIKTFLKLPGAGRARARAQAPNGPRFAGVFPDRTAALAALPDVQKAGYDDASIADVSFDWMCQRESWDYPVLYWLKELSKDGTTILDAGGHLGTKYIAFSGVWDMNLIQWVVYDTPGIIGAAKTRQAQGHLPAAITFEDNIAALPNSDILVASGLIQYLDQPFEAFLGSLPNQPEHILLNKVPLKDGEGIVTIERIGTARVPYQIRSKAGWIEEIAALGYQVQDSWQIDSLRHEIATHPWLGRNESMGYLLRRL